MAEKNKQFTAAIWAMMEQLLEVDRLEDALSGTLSILVKTLKAEAGAIWFLDEKTNRLFPVFHIGPADISNISIENGVGLEGVVTETGKSLLITDCTNDPRFQGTVFDDQGLKARSLICVPLNDLHKTLGCIQVINKQDGELFTGEELDLCEKMAALAAMTIDEKGLAVKAEEPREILATLKNVSKTYRSGDETLQVLKDVNLEIYKNELVVILGESGCGKTTLMNILGGMDSLTDGSIVVGGRELAHAKDAELTQYRREFVGFVFQSYNLMPNLTALENVRFIAELVKQSMPSEEAIALVKLTERSNHYPCQLSGGQQQRVSIARAIVKRPKLILADEPTAALDYKTSIEILTVIGDIVKRQDTTVMMVTHNPEIAKMADRVVKIRNGQIASIKRNINPLPASELEW